MVSCRPRHRFSLILAAAAAVFLLNFISLHLSPSSNAPTLKWDNFRPLNLQRPIAADHDPSCPPRNIYIDAGANLANSMDWFNSAKGNAHPNTRWEAFSFELIPLNAHYTMLQADFRNGLRRDGAPPLPAYSWDDDKSVSFDMTTAWGRDNVRRWSQWEEGFTSQPSSSGGFERLLHLDATAEYQRMIQDASCKVSQEASKPTQQPQSILPPRFHVYPVGVALFPGNFTVEWSSSNYLNGGSNLNFFSDHHKNAPKREFRVHTVPFVHWIISSFRPSDYVFLKLDVEGAEFDILRGLFALGAADLIDEATIEFHSRIGGQLSLFAEKERMFKWLLEASGIIVHAHF